MNKREERIAVINHYGSDKVAVSETLPKNARDPVDSHFLYMDINILITSTVKEEHVIYKISSWII